MTKRYSVELSYSELRAALAATTFWEARDGGERADTQARAAKRLGAAYMDAVRAERPELLFDKRTATGEGGPSE